MKPQKLRDEMDYRVCLSVFKALQKSGVELSAREMAKIDTVLSERFHPYSAVLCTEPTLVRLLKEN